MTSTFITKADLKEFNTAELQSKFLKAETDVARMRKVCDALPLAEASLRNIYEELTRRRLRGPRP